MHSAHELTQFDSTLFYTREFDNALQGFCIKLTPRGVDLVDQYYAEKYLTHIHFFDEKENDEKNSAQKDEYYYLSQLNQFLADKQNAPRLEQERDALYINKMSGHATMIFYLKEGKEEALLIADSRGTRENVSIAEQIRARSELAALNSMKLYIPPKGRQEDYFSCYTDALILARDVTKIKNKKYFIPHLLQTLKERIVGDKKEGQEFYFTKLPNELLKTAQHKKFVEYHQDEKTSQSLQKFRDRYKSGLFKNSYPPREGSVPDYLRIKGFKLTNIIEIQFYIDQIRPQLGAKFTAQCRQEFITQAKNILKEQGYLNRNRPGIHEFAKDFLNKKLALNTEISSTVCRIM